jgi:dihydroorotate dehydrogenase electron transfer subunit
MACGIGVCHGCAVKVKDDSDIGVTYKTVCKDGPVFDAREVVWE